MAAGDGGVDLCSRLAGVGHDERGASGRPVDSADRHDVRHRVGAGAGGHPGSELERGADVRAVGALQPQVCHRPAALEVQGGRGPGRGDRRVHRRVRGAGRSRTGPGGRSDEGERLVARREHRLGVRPRAELHRVVRNGASHGLTDRLARQERVQAGVRAAAVVAAVVDEPCGRRGGGSQRKRYRERGRHDEETSRRRPTNMHAPASTFSPISAINWMHRPSDTTTLVRASVLSSEHVARQYRRVCRVDSQSDGFAEARGLLI